MKRIIFSLLLASVICLAASAQQTDKTAVNEALKKELIAKLSMTEDAAGKAVVIEAEFYTALATASAMPVATTTEQNAQHKKIHEAHVSRREKLLALPLTGRQMEEVVMISDRLHSIGKKA